MSVPVLALFRRILRAHRQLPSEMRQLGDSYTRAEFKKHKGAKPQFIPGFVAEWTRYVELIEAQAAATASATSPIGRELSPSELGALSDEQRVQLKTLRQEADAVAAAVDASGR